MSSPRATVLLMIEWSQEDSLEELDKIIMNYTGELFDDLDCDEEEDYLECREKQINERGIPFVWDKGWWYEFNIKFIKEQPFIYEIIHLSDGDFHRDKVSYEELKWYIQERSLVAIPAKYIDIELYKNSSYNPYIDFGEGISEDFSKCKIVEKTDFIAIPIYFYDY